MTECYLCEKQVKNAVPDVTGFGLLPAHQSCIDKETKVSGVETLRAPPNPKGSGIRAGDLL